MEYYKLSDMRYKRLDASVYYQYFIIIGPHVIGRNPNQDEHERLDVRTSRWEKSPLLPSQMPAQVVFPHEENLLTSKVFYTMVSY